MGIWTCEVDTLGDDGRTRGMLLDSCSMRPLPLPLFDSTDAAEGFLEYAEHRGFHDVRRLEPEQLDDLHSQWIASGSPGVLLGVGS